MAQTPADALTAGQVRALLTALSHDDVDLLALAARSFAASLYSIDHINPSSEIRTNAERLSALAESMLNANRSRTFILKDV